jgi:phosphatidylglycerol---prolipoprotein diacylglyceryl transferase
VILILPYVTVPPLRAGALTFHAFGLLVAAGIVAGAWVASGRAQRLGLDDGRFAAATLASLVAGLAGAALLERVAYGDEGLSSFGGFLGATLGLVAYGRRRLPLLPAADALATGLPVGWLLGRAGCALAHDHPGVRSTSALAVAYPGGPRLDLGLLELLATPLLVLLVLATGRRARRPGSTVAALAIAYALVRFPLDFLRAPAAAGGDVRWLGLTPGQYGAVLLLGAGLAIAARPPRLTTARGGSP